MAVALAAAVAVGVATVGAACADQPTPEQPVRLAWQEVSVPVPPGPPGRLALRDAAECGQRSYLAGAVAAADGSTRPAVWTSTDATTWSALPLTPISYYGHRSIVYTVACRDNRPVAVGGRSGGAHGNPRVSSWYLAADGVLKEVIAPFELYGGPLAVNVGRVTAGPAGYLISGNRVSGAAVWLSPDGTEFQLVEAAPQLAVVPGMVTWAHDAVAGPDGWTVVGGVIRSGRTDRDPAAWTSADGRTWRRHEVPGGPEYDELTRVVAHDGTLVAVGLRGDTFQAWRLAADGWQRAGRFGSTRPSAATGPVTAPVATGLTTVRDRLVAVVADGVTYRLWISADSGASWRPLLAPIATPAGAELSVAVARVGSQLLLLIDDRQSSRVFLADLGPS